jgi:iron-sulfur cluster assembly accessory protein
MISVDEKKAPVEFTEGALQKLKEIRTENIEVLPYLRIGVKGGGCSGLTYLLAYDQATDKDDHYTISGIDVIMEKAHSMYVTGMVVDYEHGLNSRGFEFKNPNAKETCGCGTSFAT